MTDVLCLCVVTLRDGKPQIKKKNTKQKRTKSVYKGLYVRLG